MHMTYTTYFTRDVNRMAEFYVAIGLEEIVASRSDLYREVSAGAVRIGFAGQAAYASLNLADDADPTGLRGAITLDVGMPEDVGSAVQQALDAGGTLAKPGFETSFGQFLAVVKDPEGNAVRLAAAIAQ